MLHSKLYSAINTALHSRYGFSGQPRTMACGGSIEMSKGIDSETNSAAELGTAVHELIEIALKFGLSCYDFIGLTFNKIVMSEDDAENGQVYVNYVRQLKIQYPNMTFYYEQKVCMSSVSNELWGTSDLIGIDLSLRLMIVLDYKNGWVNVEIDGEQVITGFGSLIGNAQCVGYGLATMDTFSLWGKIDRVITGIIQPNVEHVDGVIRTKEFNMGEMTQWHRAYNTSHGRNDLVAGTWCTYCLAAGTCSKRIERTIGATFFNQAISTLDENQIITILPELKTMKRTIEAIEKQALSLARSGKKLTDYKLVKAIVQGRCTDEDAFVADAVAHASHEQFSDQGDISEVEYLEFERELKTKFYNKPKIKGMTALKALNALDKSKLLPKELVNKYYEKPEAGTVLVPITDKRAALMPDQRPSVSGSFSVVD